MDEGLNEVPLAELGEQGAAFVAGLVDAFGLDATVASHEIEQDMVEVRVDGADLGILIGPRGQTLAAVQELARTVAQRRGSGNVGRLVVEVSGYRRKRREALERFALQVASDVLASGERKALEPMGAADRKAVHDALTAVEGVTTSSEGEEPHRRVVILPT